MKKAEIKLTIELDDNNVPESIMWESTDAQTKEALPVKSMMLALWDQIIKTPCVLTFGPRICQLTK